MLIFVRKKNSFAKKQWVVVVAVAVQNFSDDSDKENLKGIVLRGLI